MQWMVPPRVERTITRYSRETKPPMATTSDPTASVVDLLEGIVASVVEVYTGHV